MSLSSFGFLIEEASRNVRRNGLMSAASITTVAVAMAVLGSAVFLLHRVQQFMDAQPRQFEIAAFVTMETSRSKAAQLKAKVQRIPGVYRVSLVPREAALRQMMDEDHKAGTRITDALVGANPLPDRLDVQLSDPKATRRVAAILRDKDKFPAIEHVRDDRETLDKLLATTRLIRNVGMAVALLLFLATAFVIQNTIRLTIFARRREIRVMQLVGASSGFIRMPLVIEGVFCGLAGSIIACGLVLLVIRQVSQFAGRLQTPFAFTMPAAMSPSVIVGLLLAAGAAMGWVSSTLSIRRYLRRV